MEPRVTYTLHRADGPASWHPVDPKRPLPSDVYMKPALLSAAKALGHAHVMRVDKWFNFPRRAFVVAVFSDAAFVEAEIPTLAEVDDRVVVDEAAKMLANGATS